MKSLALILLLVVYAVAQEYPEYPEYPEESNSTEEPGVLPNATVSTTTLSPITNSTTTANTTSKAPCGTSRTTTTKPKEECEDRAPELCAVFEPLCDVPIECDSVFADCGRSNRNSTRRQRSNGRRRCPARMPKRIRKFAQLTTRQQRVRTLKRAVALCAWQRFAAPIRRPNSRRKTSSVARRSPFQRYRRVSRNRSTKTAFVRRARATRSSCRRRLRSQMSAGRISNRRRKGQSQDTERPAHRDTIIIIGSIGGGGFGGGSGGGGVTPPTPVGQSSQLVCPLLATITNMVQQFCPSTCGLCDDDYEYEYRTDIS